MQRRGQGAGIGRRASDSEQRRRTVNEGGSAAGTACVLHPPLAWRPRDSYTVQALCGARWQH